MNQSSQLFNILKEALIEAPILQPPNWSLPFEIYCDASEFSVGAILRQRKEQKPEAIFYASKPLNGPQLHYSVIEKELLAVIFALEKFRSYVLVTRWEREVVDFTRSRVKNNTELTNLGN